LEAAIATSGSFVTVTDVSHGRARLGLFGPGAALLLGRLCGLDFHDRAFPDGAARQSSVAKTTQLILRHDALLPDSPGTLLPGYSVIGARSLAGYLWQTIMAAGSDLGLRPMGWRAAAVLMGWAAE
jgi:heterotetrameric sarcosine oxidase gamma subunit